MDIGVYVMAPPNQPHGDTTLVVGSGSDGRSLVTTAELRTLVAHAEGVGFDTFWLPDHVVMPAKYSSRYPYQAYAPGEEFKPYPFDAVPFPEPFTALAYVAGATDRIRLATGVLILPERNPVLFAKQVATLDSLSGGRLELGIGLGWLKEEYDALGVEWSHRGRRMDEYIEAMRRLWRDDVASYHGEFVSFTDISCDPKPRQPGGVPLIIGGHSEAAARRAGRIGDGFIPTGFEGDYDMSGLVALARRTAEENGRDPAAVRMYAGAAADPKMLDELEQQGVAAVFIAAFPTDLDSGLRWLDEVEQTVLRPRR